MCGWPGVEKFFNLYCVFEWVHLLGDRRARISQFLNYAVNITWSHSRSYPSLAQLVERRTVVVQIILRSLVRIRQLGNPDFSSSFCSFFSLLLDYLYFYFFPILGVVFLFGAFYGFPLVSSFTQKCCKKFPFPVCALN